MKFSSSLLALVGAAALVSSSPIAAPSDEPAPSNDTPEYPNGSCEVVKHWYGYDFFVGGSEWVPSEAHLKQAVGHCGIITAWHFNRKSPDVAYLHRAIR